MTATGKTRPNPYVGPRAFRRGETLYGRDRERKRLLNLLIAERIVLLYSPSGAGKTSLVQAALIPDLGREGFKVHPIMRVNGTPPPGDLQGINISNRYILSMLLSLEEVLPPEQKTSLAELAGMTLIGYVEQRWKTTNTRDDEILIFDQFEEILTLDPTDRPAKAEFFAQVGALLRDCRLWALFSMREDYVASLDPYLRAVPTRLNTGFRLDLLQEETAREAIQKPAAAAEVPFTEAAARRLIDNLRRVWVQRPDGTRAEHLGPYIEPVQLQVVCYRLWERLRDDESEIREEDVEHLGDVDKALSDYYAMQVTKAAREARVRERAIREWFDRYLITEQGLRGQVLRGAGQSQGLENDAIDRLVDAYLVRKEERRGAIWFELTHDRMIEPVRKNNAAWREANLSPLQRQAALWQDQNRPNDLLVRDEALEEMEGWAAAHADELTATEKDFLDACQEARAIAKREKRNNRIIRGLFIFTTLTTIGLGVVFVAMLFFYWYAVKTEQKAHLTLLVSTLTDLSANKQDDRSALLARQAFRLRQTIQDGWLDRLRKLLNPFWLQSTQPQLETLDNRIADALRRVLSTRPTRLRPHEAEVSSVAFSPDGKPLAAGSRDDTAWVWDVTTGRTRTSIPLQEEARVIALSPAGTLLATVSTDNTVRVWEVTTGRPRTSIALQGEVRAIALGPEGKKLAVGGGDGTMRLWDLDNPRASPRALDDHYEGVRSVAFSPDGKTLVSASGDMDDTNVLISIIYAEDLAARVCETVQRNLTLDEWHQFMGAGIPYERTCPERPIHPSVIEHGKRLAGEGDLDGAIAIFQMALKLDREGTLALEPSLGSDPKSAAEKLAAPSLVQKGKNLASEAKVDEAIALFERALKWDPSLNLDLKVELKRAVPALAAKGRRLASAGDEKGAIALLEQAQKLDPDRKLDPQGEANKWAAQGLVDEGKQLVRQGKVKEALQAYVNAQQRDPTLEIRAESWNTLCWFGSLWDRAADVMDACKKAVALSREEKGYIRDSRGIARALTGDRDGAIEDFQAYIAQLKDQKKRSQRQRWIDALQAGQDPFTPEELEKLRNP